MSGIERWRGLARPSRLLAAGLVTLGAAGIALAADAAVSEGQVRALLKARLPKTVIGSVDCATIGGLCEVVAGDNLFYVDAGARYLVIGRVYDMETRQRSEEHTSELQSLMRISYAVFCLKKKNTTYERAS